MPSLRDIARSAGCSANTVSLALRDHPKISAARREQIRKLAKQMGYRPDPLVNALFQRRALERMGKAGVQATIAVLDPLKEIKGRPGFQLVRRLEAGLRERLAATGFAVETFGFADWEKRPERFIGILQNRGVCGIVFSHFRELHFSLGWDLSDFALVALGYSLESPRLHRVVENHTQGMQLVLGRLKELGYQQPGLAMPLIQSERGHYQQEGVFLTHAGRVFGRPPIPPLEQFDPEVSLAQLTEWYARHRPDVIIGHRTPLFDELARRFALEIPRQLAFVNLNSGASGRKSAGLDIQPELYGRTLANVLIAQLNRNERGIPEMPLITLVPSQWVDGPECPPK